MIVLGSVPRDETNEGSAGVRIAFTNLDSDWIEVLNQIRIDQQVREADMKSYQKQMPRPKDDEPSYQKFFKEEGRDALKMYRAACCILGELSPNCYGDCPPLGRHGAPLELKPYIERVVNLAEAEIYETHH